MTDWRVPASKEWNAAVYHVVSEPQFAWGLRVLDRVAVAGNEHVLDAGCGSGRLTMELAARVPAGRVVACDLSDNMVRVARKTLGVAPDRIVVRADLSQLPFRSAFDLIFSTATFHWVRDHERLFKELRGALRSDGRLEAQCGGGRNLALIHGRADSLASQAQFRDEFRGWQEPWLFASPDETEDRLRRAGFATARCWLEYAPTTFQDAAHYRDFVQAVVLRPYLSRISNEALRARFLETLVGEASTDDPPMTLDYWRLNISARASQ
jgi:trans-aconitate 2-methyltransferase